MQGVIVKGIAGFYYVEAEGFVYECKARGIFRKDGITPLVGDKVLITTAADGTGTVDEILPRVNAFDRPPVANVETMVLVAAAKDPDPSFPLLDRFTVMAEKSGCETAICVNKADIGSEEILNRFKNIYSSIFPVFIVSGETGSGVSQLKEFLRGKQAALAGPSGVGKSTLTNLLLETQASETGEISRKTLRGKNTTRHTELFSGDGFKLFDTPGFTSFEINEVEESDLQHYFPEFRPYLGKCRFDNCRHLKEPDCAVAQAAKDLLISRRRYASYKDMLTAAMQQKKY
ncbi:MAG: ribosome small subunit-dependent GTPase A [Clostridia bacterium]|nr:ribosome small subunit-dependent GTPase A [Clostridia bacterium]